MDRVERPVILDTNFLLIPFQFKIDIFEGIERILARSHYFVISSKTIKELKYIARGTNKDGRSARLAIKLIEANKNRIEIIENEEEVDLWIEKYATEKRAVVCTNDAQLRSKIKKEGLRVISLKNRTKIGVA